MKTKRKIKKRQFSLLEIIIAITIVALIAAIAVPGLLGDAEAAKAKAAVVEINNLKGAITRYKLDTGKYPGSLEDLVSNSSGAKNWKQYIEIIPKDPWGNAYVYELRPELFNKFEITSYAADGQSGGEGENADITLSKAAD